MNSLKLRNEWARKALTTPELSASTPIQGIAALMAAPSSASLIRRISSTASRMTFKLLATADPIEGGSFGSLDSLTLLFTSKQFVLVGWIHYLVFDLFVGAWEARDAARHGISRWVLVPCLLLTFLFGPSGLLLYLVLRAALRRRVLLSDGSPDVTPKV